MKVAYKLTDRARSAKLTKESYQVLAYGEFHNKAKFFLIADDDLRIISPSESVLDIIDTDSSEYERHDELNYGKPFYILKPFLNYVSRFENYFELQFNNIWNLSKISKFFTDSGYQIPESYRNTVLNIPYKMNLIEGYLMFANSYINIKHAETGGYWDELVFFKTDNQDLIVDEKFKNDKKVTHLESENYQSHLKAFIKKYLFDQTPNEKKSAEMCDELYRLIDSIFISQVGIVFTVETFYDDCFVVEYESNFYCLNKTWGS